MMMAPPRKYLDGDPTWATCPQCEKPFRRKIREPRVYTNGEPRMQKFCSKDCSNKARGLDGHFDRHGYRVVSMGSRAAGVRPEHHIVMERIIGRPILKGETVHHKNGKRADNRPENLELWSSRHGKGQRVEERIDDAKAFLAEHGLWDNHEYGDSYILALAGY